MFRNLFQNESPLMITMSQITDCIFLSLFFLLGCIPVLTVGASLAALYDGVYYAYRRGDKHSWQRFFKTWRACVLPGLVPTGVFLVLFLGGGWGLIQLWNAAVYGKLSWMLFSGGALLAAAGLGILSVLFPMLSRFENPTGALLKNTLFLSLANLPRTLALGVVNLLSFLACLVWVLPVFFLPALAALIGTVFIEPMFRPYMPQDSEEPETGKEAVF